MFSDIESFEANFSSRMIDDQNTDMSILYLCLLEKIMKLLHCHITPVQNFQVMKGTWNILVKYWRDIGYKCYEGVGNHVEWGLLELLNFDLSATPRERFEAEDKVQYFSEKEIC